MDQRPKQDLKQLMPKAAEWIAEKRNLWGDAHVREMQRRAQKGERNCCWIVERTEGGTYRSFGAPFDGLADEDLRFIGECFVLGSDLLAFMKTPEGVVGGVKN